jgi:hypothetical protein
LSKSRILDEFTILKENELKLCEENELVKINFENQNNKEDDYLTQIKRLNNENNRLKLDNADLSTCIIKIKSEIENN